MKTKIGVIGLGIGQEHLRQYVRHRDVEIAGVVDLNEKLGREVARKYRTNAYVRLEDLLSSVKDLDGVSICTTPRSHLELVELCAGQSVHVLCEKPMAPSVAECRRMMEVCEKKGVFLMIGFKKRFSPAYSFLKEKFDGVFGRPVFALVKFALGRVNKDWFWDEKDGGGPMKENTVHVIDLLRYFMGEVESIYAAGGNFFVPERAPQIDTAAIVLRFVNGGVAAIGAGYASEWGFAKEEMMFTTGKTVCEINGAFDSPSVIQYVVRDRPARIYRREFPEPSGFAEEISHFLDCVRRNATPAVSGRDGLAALEICQAVKQSIRLKKQVSFSRK